MKVTFIATIKEKKKYGSSYSVIVKSLESLGVIVFHDHVTKYAQEDLDRMSQDERISFHNKILHKIKECDVVVAEVSYSSMGVGFLISSALDFQKPTILLYKGQKPTNILSILEENDKMVVLEYKDDSDLTKLLKDSLEYAAEKQDVRFNFFVSPEIQQYLDWVAKYKRTPRAVYLRELLEEDMKANKDWKKQK